MAVKYQLQDIERHDGRDIHVQWWNHKALENEDAAPISARRCATGKR